MRDMVSLLSAASRADSKEDADHSPSPPAADAGHSPSPPTTAPLGGFFSFSCKLRDSQCLSMDERGGVTVAPAARSAAEYMFVEPLGADSVAIRTCFGTYLSPQPDGSISTAPSIRGAWEVITVVPVGDEFAFRSCHGHFLCLQTAACVESRAPLRGAVVWNRPWVEGWERFQLVPSAVVITAKHSGKVLDVSGGAHVDGAPVIQFGSHGGANQRMALEHRGGGWFMLRFTHSGKALDVDMRASGHSDGAGLIQWAAHGGDNQLFRFERRENDDCFLLRVKHTGKVIDVCEGQTTDGAQIIQYTAHGGANQLFTITCA